MRLWAIGASLLGILGLVGCSSKSAASPTAATEAPSAGNAGQSVALAAAQPGAPAMPQPTKPIAVPANASPDQVVTVFLNSLRAGDSPTTESLLTLKAREELAKHALSVDVQSAPNSTYQVHPAVILPDNPDGAHVSSTWTEKFDDGEETYEIVWVLRRQPEGWRLAGMAMELIPGQQPQFLNFEDPADMLQKKDQAIAAMQPPAAETAQQPSAVPPNGQQPVIER
jgi:hypothetical protein